MKKTLCTLLGIVLAQILLLWNCGPSQAQQRQAPQQREDQDSVVSKPLTEVKCKDGLNPVEILGCKMFWALSHCTASNSRKASNPSNDADIAVGFS